ncbi:MAG: hypothetical protein ASARMPREDX12_001728 [Alectoria sarmentosa]|nr:MAG: hypothetical protein ASARMPREDX12_001728 [Alectoria sarmentosa]
MTSHAWQTGNVYGGYVAPRYNAISYTWGRYALQSLVEKPHVSALNISGISWNIPRVDPEVHFSLEQFDALVRKATVEQIWVADSENKVDFVWLDVACIDQTFPRWATLEIGRQAAIFGGANCVYVWLSHLYPRSARVAAEKVLETGQCALQLLKAKRDSRDIDEAQSSSFFIEAAEQLPTLLSDPWFSSLWTLQEAYLCPAAMILAIDSTPVCLIKGKYPLSLHDLSQACQNIRNVCQYHLESPYREDEPIKMLLDSIKRSGLDMLVRTQPLALYAAAQFRQASNTLDRIYGIMQVFGFRLGNAAEDKIKSIEYSLTELEAEFGAALVSQFPILGQLFVHLCPIEAGKGWHVSSKCAIPAFAQSGPVLFSSLTQSYQISTKDVRGVTWAWIQGVACEFGTVRRAWLDLYGDASRWGPAGSGWEEIPGEYQHYLAARLTGQYPADLQLLFLGGVEPEVWNEPQYIHRFYYGLILLRQTVHGNSIWRRLGVCQWILLPENEEAEQNSFLKGQSDDWKAVQGLYG